jgi:hypothetical protein
MSNQLIVQVFGMIKSREITKKQADDTAYYSAYETDATLKPKLKTQQSVLLPNTPNTASALKTPTDERSAEEMRRLKA